MNPEQYGELHLNRLLFPDLAGKLDAALARHGAANTAVSDFDAGLDSIVNERFAGAGFGALVQTAGGSRLADAFEGARAVVSWAVEAGLDLKLPEPEAFEAAGGDLARLAELLTGDGDLVAVPTPFGLGARGWSALFEHAAGQPGSPFGTARTVDPSEQEPVSDPQPPLLLASEVAREFASLDDVSLALQHATQVAAVSQSGMGRPGVVTDGRVTWTLRLIPATPAPPRLGLNFTNCGPHVTLPEMLMLQLMRAAKNVPPLDGGDGRSSFTWLAGKIGDGRLAARHVYDESERAIRITAREIGSQGPHLGARQPVTEE